MDLSIEVPPVCPSDLLLPPPTEDSATVAARVAAAREAQRERLRAFERRGRLAAVTPASTDAATALPEVAAPRAEPPGVIDLSSTTSGPRCNADLQGEALQATATPDRDGQALLAQAMERLHLSARGYHRILRVARTLADLDGSDAVRRLHVAEAISYRQTLQPRSAAAAA